ncbi:major facilitator superfamily domain-containing protein [Ochromonadaceae sp. CCMP2298]|nr:major facilitator superfamily domain-containing protein [Ochromonadaceae sp. CCMP2298]
MRTISMEEALGLIPTGFAHYRLVVLCGLSFMADSLELTLLSFLAPCAAEDWSLTYSERATITSMVFVGIVLGSLFWGQFADRHGRRATFLASMSLVTVGGFLSAVAPNYQLLTLFRGIAGFGIGGATVPFDLVSEFIVSEQRGYFLILTEYFWCLGSILIASLAWACLDSLGWRFLAFAATLPVCATLFVGFFCLPESPRWLLLKGREDEALEVLRATAAANGAIFPDNVRLEGQGQQ